MNLFNPNTIQGRPTQRGPSKVASSSREGSLQIQTKVARGINLVFDNNCWKLLDRQHQILWHKIFPKVAFGTPSVPRAAPKPFEFKWWDFLTSPKPDLVLCLYMICAHITGRETRALQRSAALKIQMELKTGEHRKAPLHCINDRKANSNTLLYVGSSFNRHLLDSGQTECCTIFLRSFVRPPSYTLFPQ